MIINHLKENADERGRVPVLSITLAVILFTHLWLSAVLRYSSKPDTVPFLSSKQAL